MTTPPVRKREIAAWCTYDVASSAFSTVMVAVVFNIYFVAVVAEGRDIGDFLWGVCTSVSALLVALSSPLLGAYADRAGRKKRLLLLYTAIYGLGCVLLAYAGPGDVLFAMVVFILANAAFEGTYVFLNGFLPELVAPEKLGRISGIGWGVGYVGGLTSMFIASQMIPAGDAAYLADYGAVQEVFLVVAAFVGIASLPTFLLLQERANVRPRPPRGHLRASLRELRQTLRHVRRYRQLTRFLLAFFCYNDAVQTTILVTGLYATKTLGFTASELVTLFMVFQVGAAVGAFAFGFIHDKLGAKRTILVTISLFTVVTAVAISAPSKATFWVLVNIAALGLGAIQSSSRSAVALLSPKHKSGEFFGFMAVSGRFSTVIGPAAFGVISWLTGSQQLALVPTLLLFVIGGVLLWRVDEVDGRAVARAVDAELEANRALDETQSDVPSGS